MHAIVTCNFEAFFESEGALIMLHTGNKMSTAADFQMLPAFSLSNLAEAR